MKLLRFWFLVCGAAVLVACGGAVESEDDSANEGIGKESLANPLSASDGSSQGSYTVGGTVTGLSGQLVLSSSKGTLVVAETDALDGAAGFVFQDAFFEGDTYAVTVTTQPSGQACSVSNGVGTLSNANVSDIAVACLPATVTVNGAVRGLNGEIGIRLTVVDNAQDVSAAGDEAGQALFEFTEKVPAAQPYSISVMSQPDQLSCAAETATGTTPADRNATLSTFVNCEFLGYRVSGVASGLQGTLALSLRATEAGAALDAPPVATEALSVSTENFNFSSRLDVGVNYEVTISAQPDSQFCTLSNGVSTIGENGADALTINCENLSVQTASLSGRITLASNIVADSDLNDASVEVVDNSSFATAQAIATNATVQGFVTLAATGQAGDNFAADSDEHDYFSVTLEQGQGILLTVVDSDQNPSPSVYQGDLDLYLFDAEFELVAFSNGSGETESVVAPSDGQYYIDVVADSGASKYILNLQAQNVSASANASVDFVPNEAIMQVDSNRSSFAGPSAMMSSMRLSHGQADRPTLANFSSRTSLAAAFQASANSPANMDELASLNSESYEKVSTLKMIKGLRKDPDMMFVEPNYVRHAFLTPNDEFYNLQWHYPAMNLPQAWDITTGAPQPGQNDVIVAVVDTGVFTGHLDLVGQLVPGYDFISNSFAARDGDGIDANPDDPGDSFTLGQSSWHGTHVAGTVAARSNDNVGVAGVSWGAKVMPLRVLGAFGGTAYDIMQAVRYAAGLSNDSGTVPAQSADIINLSLGGGAASDAEAQLYELVHSMGIIVVAAAGNSNSSAPAYPAAYDGVVSVAAVDVNGDRAGYSNFGNTIDIAAPGGDVLADENSDGFADGVLSTSVDDTSGNRVSALTFQNGTSMSAPHVAGMIALMKSVYPQLTAADFDALLQNGMLTDEAGGAGRDDIFGYGIANALKSVQVAQSLGNGTEVVPAFPTNLLAQPSSVSVGALDLAQIQLSLVGDDALSVTRVEVSEAWLTVSENDVSNDGFGMYDIGINRAGLNDGSYEGFITFSAFGTNPISVRVSMTVGAVEADGKTGTIYAMVVDPDTHVVITEVVATDNGDGTASFTLPAVPAGYYKIMASTDIDNDAQLCQLGEACGAYPTLAEPEVLLINGQDRSEMDFDFNIISSPDMLEENAPAVQRQ